MRIDQETVDRIKQSVDIVEVIGDFVSLKKRGANYMACCPFHGEKTPSFNVNPARQIYKCFGCGAAGDAIKFVMDIDGIGYVESLRYLAQKYQIEVQEEEVTDEEFVRQNERESLYIVLNFAKEFFNHQLSNDAGAAIGLSYFRERGYDDSTIRRFELGYSPDEWDAFLKEATAKGYPPELLEKAGLIVRKDNGKSEGYDRFRGRVIFPIHNVAGKVIAFGARILKTDKSKNAPKYLNSPETDVYHKSEVLYGIFQARNEIRQQDICFLVEGYTDVITLHRAGIENVVASSGTSLTVEQIRLIGRFTKNITILYDGDKAGIKAALRGLDLVLEEGLNVSIVALPDGEDPDSFAKNVGGEAFKEYIRAHTRDFISYKTEILLADVGDDPFKKAALINDVVQSITKIPGSITRQVFFRKTSELLGIEEQVLITEANKLIRKNAEQPKEPRRSGPVPDGPAEMPFSPEVLPPVVPEKKETEWVDPVSIHEEECIRLLINYGKNELEPGITLCHYMLSELSDIDFKVSVYQEVIEIFRSHFLQNTIPDTDYFLQHPDITLKNRAIDMVTTRHQVSELWTSRYEIYIPTEQDKLADLAFTNILRIKKGHNDLILKGISEQLKSAGTEEETDRLLELFMNHKAIEKEIATLLGTVISA